MGHEDRRGTPCRGRPPATLGSWPRNSGRSRHGRPCGGRPRTGRCSPFFAQRALVVEVQEHDRAVPLREDPEQAIPRRQPQILGQAEPAQVVFEPEPRRVRVGRDDVADQPHDGREERRRRVLTVPGWVTRPETFDLFGQRDEARLELRQVQDEPPVAPLGRDGGLPARSLLTRGDRRRSPRPRRGAGTGRSTPQCHPVARGAWRRSRPGR